MDTFKELYRRIGVLKRRRAALDADLRAAYMLSLREAIMDRIRQCDTELDDAFLRIKALQDGMQPDLFGG